MNTDRPTPAPDPRDLADAVEAAEDFESAMSDLRDAVNTPTKAIDLALAFQRLLDVVPTVTRYNKRTGMDEPSQEVRLTFRRKSGQWYAGVGKTGRTGTSPHEAISALADALEEAERDKAAHGTRVRDAWPR